MVFLLASCRVMPTVQGSTEIQARMAGNAFQPREWPVLSGQEITLTVTNEDSALHDWTLLNSFIDLPVDSNASIPIRFTRSVAPGETLTVKFKAPAAPGEYMVFSTPLADQQAKMTAILLVVMPDAQ